MSVKLGGGFSIVMRAQAIAEANLPSRGIRLEDLGDVHSSDGSLIVLGPYFETQTVTRRLTELGLRYFDDFFDIPHSGGTVPDWCEVVLQIRE